MLQTIATSDAVVSIARTVYDPNPDAALFVLGCTVVEVNGVATGGDTPVWFTWSAEQLPAEDGKARLDLTLTLRTFDAVNAGVSQFTVQATVSDGQATASCAWPVTITAPVVSDPNPAPCPEVAAATVVVGSYNMDPNRIAEIPVGQTDPTAIPTTQFSTLSVSAARTVDLVYHRPSNTVYGCFKNAPSFWPLQRWTPGSAPEALFFPWDQPTSIAVDGTYLWYTDGQGGSSYTSGRILRYALADAGNGDLNGELVHEDPASFDWTYAICVSSPYVWLAGSVNGPVDADGYVTSAGRIMRYNLDGTGATEIWYAEDLANGVYPQAMRYDPCTNTLYVGLRGQNRIVAIPAGGGSATTVWDATGTDDLDTSYDNDPQVRAMDIDPQRRRIVFVNDYAVFTTAQLETWGLTGLPVEEVIEAYQAVQEVGYDGTNLTTLHIDAPALSGDPDYPLRAVCYR